MRTQRPTLHVAVSVAAVIALTGCGQRSDARTAVHSSPAAAVAAAPQTTAPAAAEAPSPTPAVPDPPSDAAQTADDGAASPSPGPAVAAGDGGGADAGSKPQAPRPRRDESPAPATPAPSDPGSPLWGRTFASVRVTEDGRRKALVADTRLRVNPFRRSGEGQIRYSGDCNTAGASLTVTTTRFDVGEDGGSTAMGCPEDQQQQGDWFRQFVTSDPQWSLSKDQRFLKLTSGDIVILFEEHPWPPYGDD